MTQTTPRYVVEPGTDGSWLIVDRGEDRAGRRAIERLTDEPAARREAEALARLEDLSAAPATGAPDDEFDAMFAAALEHGQAVDVVHNFDHLLQPQP
ncbi:hypothetical protein ACWED2_01660 [Amycolatopsis sp. NPDC005003]